MRIGGWRIVGFVVALAMTTLGVAASALGAPATGPLTLPETLRGTVQVPQQGMAETGAADTLKELYPILAACWEVPPGLARFERTESGVVLITRGMLAKL